jgi:hypothetical protein
MKGVPYVYQVTDIKVPGSKSSVPRSGTGSLLFYLSEIQNKCNGYLSVPILQNVFSRKRPGRIRIQLNPYRVINWPPGSGSVIQKYESADSDNILQIFAYRCTGGVPVGTSITTIAYMYVKG